jgi:tetratricopeptide (TPR) repeat protein
MDAQLQIRQNALEAQDFAQDLLQWTQSMSQKSAGKQSSQQQNDQGVPSVRGRAPGSVQAAPVSMQQPSMQPSKASAARTNRPPAAHTYANYSKWDKFDPDAAESAPDQPAAVKQASKQPPAAISKPERPAESQASTAKQQPSPAAEAVALKDRGNKLFQAGYFDDAVGCYTQSIALQPTFLAYANRAMARLKLGQPAEAEQDCTAALQLDSSYIKALHRRGTARRQLGRLLEAAVDFEEALRLEPGNTTVQADRDAALEQHLQQQELQESSAAWSSIPVAAPPLPPQQQQQPQQDQQQQQRQDPQEQQMVLEAASSKRVAVLGSEAAASKSADSADSIAAAAVNATSSTAGAAAAAVAAAARQPPSRSPSPQQASTAAAAAAAAALAARRAASLKAPRTGNDFEAAWRSFKGDMQLQVRCLVASATAAAAQHHCSRELYWCTDGLRSCCSGGLHLC